MFDENISLSEILKILPGFALFPFSIYLAWKKFGFNVAAHFSVGGSNLNARRLDDIVLTNHKDRPVTIFSIHASNEKSMITWEVEKFSPPIILKPYETVSIKTSEYSAMYLNGQKYNIEYSFDISIWLDTERGMRRCNKPKNIRDPLCIVDGKYSKVSKTRQSFNGVVYDDRALYAISYYDKKVNDLRTGIVLRGGVITGEWAYRINMVSKDFLNSKESVKDYLNQAGFGDFYEFFVVDKLDDL